LLNKIKPHILELPLSKILIYQTSSFTLRCRDKDTMMKGCNYCMMTIPCQCRVIGNNMQFDQKDNGSSSMCGLVLFYKNLKLHLALIFSFSFKNNAASQVISALVLIIGCNVHAIKFRPWHWISAACDKVVWNCWFDDMIKLHAVTIPFHVKM
jgi:hypothetical protein